MSNNQQSDGDTMPDIEFFHSDPDGDDGRAGDGWYYRYPDDIEWTGPYASFTDAGLEAGLSEEEISAQI